MSQGVGPATDNPVQYISHHLEPLQAGSGFWTFNIDTMFFSTLIMFGVMFVAFRVGRNVTAGAPTGMQNIFATSNFSDETVEIISFRENVCILQSDLCGQFCCQLTINQ